jgi:PAS domain S-box-containing protein
MIGILVLIGWTIDNAFLKSLVQGFISMKPNTALSFVLIGGALWCFSLKNQTAIIERTALACASAVTMLGMLTTVEYLLNWNPGFDQWLFEDSLATAGPWAPGRMGMNTALCFSLFGSALLLNKKGATWIALIREGCTLGGILLAFVALLGYLYGERLLYGIGPYTSMALHTSLTVLVAGVGLLFLHPDQGLMAVLTTQQAGGYALRRMLPGLLVVLPTIGWFSLAGQRHSLYGTELGLAIFATLATVTLFALLWWTARSLNAVAQAHDLARQARDESERRFRQLAESIREVFWLSDPSKQQVLYVSPAYETIWGRSCESIYTSPASWAEAIHPDDRDRIWQAALTRQTLGTYDEEYRIVTPHGGVRWIRDRAFPVKNDRGQIYRIAGIAEDITERKQAEVELRESEERFERAFRASPHPVGITELDSGICVDANDACLSLFGFSREEVIGTSTLDLHIWPTPDHRKRFVELLRVHGSIQNQEVTVRTKHGSLLHCLVSSELMELGGVRCLLTVGNDITDRKRAETELQQAHDELEARVLLRTKELTDANLALTESEERFRQLFEDSPVAMSISDDAGRFTQVNRAYGRLLGVEPKSLIGRTCESFTHPEDVPESAELTQQFLSGHIPSYTCEKRYCLDIGRTIWVRVTVHRLALPGQTAPVGLAIIEDMTERKRMEEERERLVRDRLLLLESTSEGIYGLDVEGNCTFVNRAGATLLGYKPYELLGLRLHDIIHREEDRADACPTHLAFIGGQACRTEHDVVWRRDNTTFPVAFTASPIFESGGVRGTVVTFTDVTERKRTEEALKERARLSSFAAAISQILNRESSTEDILRHCAETVVTHLGAVLTRIWTLEPGDLCDTCFKSSLCANKAQCLHLRASAGVSTNLNGEYRRIPLGVLKVGRIAQGMGVMHTNDALGDDRLPNKEWLRAHEIHSFAGFPLVIEGAVFGVMGVFARSPWTEPVLAALESACSGIAATIARKQAEELVRTSESFLSSVLDHLPNMVFVKDSADLRFVRVNKAGEELLGLSRDEILGKCDHDFFPKDQADFFTDKDRTVIENHQLVDILEEPIQTKRKGLRYLHTKKIPLYGSAGRPQYLVGISEDITERKQAEEDLRSAYDQLRDLAHRLETARETERRRIARELHDEFGQALTGMKLDLSWFRAKISRLVPATAGKPLLKKVQDLSSSVDVLINAIRETATSLRPSILDDLGLIAALEWLVKEFRTRTAIACTLDLVGDVSRVQMTAESSTSLFRIVQELFTNVTRHAQASAVHLRLSEEEEHLVLEFTDNGTGIMPHQITQARSLGLRGMEERTALLGGSFAIDGAPGVGTTVRITLPISSLVESAGEEVR